MSERRSGIPCAVSTEHVLLVGSVVVVSAMAYEFGLLLDRSSCPSGRHVFFNYRSLDQDVYRSARSTTRPLPGKTPAGETRFGIQHSQRPSILFGPAINGHARCYSRLAFGQRILELPNLVLNLGHYFECVAEEMVGSA